MKVQTTVAVLVTAWGLAGCGVAPTHAQDPGRYALVASGSVPAAATVEFEKCLIDAFAALNFGNTTHLVQKTRGTDGDRIEVYMHRVNVAVRADVFDDGKSELRVAPDPLKMFTNEPRAFRQCVSRFGPTFGRTETQT